MTDAERDLRDALRKARNAVDVLGHLAIAATSVNGELTTRTFDYTTGLRECEKAMTIMRGEVSE